MLVPFAERVSPEADRAAGSRPLQRHNIAASAWLLSGDALVLRAN
jgi:hypothetical protein